MIQEITENSQTKLCAISKKAYQGCFQKWQQRWEQCINAGGKYIEGDEAHSFAGMTKKIIKKLQNFLTTYSILHFMDLHQNIISPQRTVMIHRNKTAYSSVTYFVTPILRRFNISI
jgi:hypothetical protein